MEVFLSPFLLWFLLILNRIEGEMGLLPLPLTGLGSAIKARLVVEVGKLVIWVLSLTPRD